MARGTHKCTPAQLQIACEAHIPYGQAHTINVEKYKRFRAWQHSAVARFERFLDSLEAIRNSILEQEGHA